MPQVTSERHAMRALVVGFLMEAATEIYQLLTTVGSLHGDPLGYYVGLGITVFGFYFLWRGMHEWNRLNPRPVRTGRRPVPWAAVSMLVGGLVATALLNIILGTVGGGDSPPPLAWVVGGVMVVAFGSFFLALRRMVAPLQNPTGRVLGWAAFAWSLGVSTIAGLALGQVIVGLFIDFFTSWPALILHLAPFIFAMAPLFVTFTILSLAYADAYRNASARGGSKVIDSSVATSSDERAATAP